MSNQTSNETIEKMLIRLKHPLQIPKQSESISAYDDRQAYHEQVFSEAVQAVATLLVKAQIDTLKELYVAIDNETANNEYVFKLQNSIEDKIQFYEARLTPKEKSGE